VGPVTASKYDRAAAMTAVSFPRASKKARVDAPGPPDQPLHTAWTWLTGTVVSRP